MLAQLFCPAVCLAMNTCVKTVGVSTLVTMKYLQEADTIQSIDTIFLFLEVRISLYADDRTAGVIDSYSVKTVMNIC